MIFDRLESCGLYKNLSENFRKAFEFLESQDLEAMAPGTYEVDGKNVYVMIKEYETLPMESCRLEFHKRYADIQLLIRGREYYGWKDSADCTVETPYDEAKDAGLYEDKAQLFMAEKGCFAVFFPQDGHFSKGCADGTVRPGKKAIVKVRL